jgi:hypothetical protein
MNQPVVPVRPVKQSFGHNLLFGGFIFNICLINPGQNYIGVTNLVIGHIPQFKEIIRIAGTGRQKLGIIVVHGIGTFIGPILGALLFFALQEIFGDFGAWYLAGIGIVAILFALYLPRGLVGLWLDRGRDEPLSMRKRLGL